MDEDTTKERDRGTVFWFPRELLAEIAARAAAAREHDDGVFYVRIRGTGRQASATLGATWPGKVDALDGDDDEINNSFPCPPIYPPGETECP